MEPLCVTGVEDMLQQNVQLTLESLEGAKIKTWMLTGDKLETAICIARSSKLFNNRNSTGLFTFRGVQNRIQAHELIRKYRDQTVSNSSSPGGSSSLGKWGKLCHEFQTHSR